ncbi:MAG: transglycosylase SLT domain-containing protein [Candidatus Woesearchaeota archaeon]|jgi:hypothetical protein|nr:transglycosylase SLT domain-containing protein [Candidatus Woesearchaeota archaeon]
MRTDYAESIDRNLSNKSKFILPKLALSSILLLGTALFSYNSGVNFSKTSIENKQNKIIENFVENTDKNNFSGFSNRIKIDNLERKLEVKSTNEELNEKLDRLLKGKYITKFAYDDFFKNGDSKAYDLYKNKKISEFALITYLRANPVIDILNESEAIFQTPEFKAIVGAESDFSPNAKSNAGAIGMAQMTKGKNGGIEGLLHTRKRDNEIVNNMLNKDKVSKLSLENYFEDSTKINLNDLGLNKETLKSYGISEIELSEVIIPRYLAMNEINFDKYTSESIKNNIRYNILAGNAHYFSGKLELSILSTVKKENPTRVFFEDVSRSELEKNLNNSAFLWNLDEFSQGAYNAGVNAFRNKYLKLAKKDLYDTFRLASNETKIHRTRINKYKEAFNELESHNVFDSENLYVTKN